MFYKNFAELLILNKQFISKNFEKNIIKIVKIIPMIIVCNGSTTTNVTKTKITIMTQK